MYYSDVMLNISFSHAMCVGTYMHRWRDGEDNNQQVAMGKADGKVIQIE
jgi:hypothetical protein